METFRNPANLFDAGASKRFSDPFILPSSASFPVSFETALDYCLFLFYMQSEYKEASKRIVAHFITELNFVGESGSKDERDELRDLLVDELDFNGMLMRAGLDWAAYGNAFVRWHMPFTRYLKDTRGGAPRWYSLSEFDGRPGVKYNHKRLTYTVPDPLTDHLPSARRRMVELPIFDIQSTDVTRVRWRILDPRYLTLTMARESGRKRIIDRFEPQFLQNIRKGVLWEANETPLPILRAVANDQAFEYDEEEVYHLYEPTVSGVSNMGWGLPNVLANYRSIHQVQVLRKVDEAVGLDYMLPFRVITPNLGTNVDEAAIRLLLGPWKGEMRKMIGKRRQDMFAFHTLPFPVNYQEFNGEGKQLSPYENYQAAVNSMLDGMGYPAELFHGTLQIQQIPTALRLFENAFHFIPWNFNRMAKHAVKKIQSFRQQEYIDPELRKPRLADDLEIRNIYLQLAAGREIPRSVGYEFLGIRDPVEAAKERMREDISIQEEQQKLQSEAERRLQMGSMANIVGQQMQEAQAQAQQGAAGPGAPAAGPAPGGGGAGPTGEGVTPLRVMDDAYQEALNLLQMEEGPRRSRLSELEVSNPPYHAAVMQQMRKIRRQGESAGRANAVQVAMGG